METSTDTVPNTVATGGSTGADFNGPAVVDACRQIAERIEPFKSVCQTSLVSCDVGKNVPNMISTAFNDLNRLDVWINQIKETQREMRERKREREREILGVKC